MSTEKNRCPICLFSHAKNLVLTLKVTEDRVEDIDCYGVGNRVCRLVTKLALELAPDHNIAFCDTVVEWALSLGT